MAVFSDPPFQHALNRADVFFCANEVFHTLPKSSFDNKYMTTSKIPQRKYIRIAGRLFTLTTTDIDKPHDTRLASVLGASATGIVFAVVEGHDCYAKIVDVSHPDYATELIRVTSADKYEDALSTYFSKEQAFYLARETIGFIEENRDNGNQDHPVAFTAF